MPKSIRIDVKEVWEQGFGVWDFDKNKKPLIVMMKGFQKKGDDILSHKLQYHLRRRA